MQEIKFRFWDKKSNVMYEGIELSKLLGYLMFQPVPNSMAYVAMQDHFSDIIWLQYTGLKDKNGKEIYEGDILELIYDDSISVCGELALYPRKRIYEVTTLWNFYMDVSAHGEDYKGVDCREVYARDSAIIGNIYENPELFGEI